MTAPYWSDRDVTIWHGDCLDVLRGMPNASVDAVVTDPPYGLEFMGREWDSPRMLGAMATGERTNREGGLAYGGTHDRGYVTHNGRAFGAWCQLWAAECLRVLKPGGHLLAFGGTRTWHRLTCAVEDAGFEIRDAITWLYGSGFPKSLDVGKAIDKRPGVGRHHEFAAHLAARREAVGLSRADVSERVVGTRTGACWNWEHHQFPEAKWWAALRDLLDLDEDMWGPVIAEAERERTGQHRAGLGTGDSGVRALGSGGSITAPATVDAARWQGWGTALKPASEPVVVARKPLTGTVAATVLAYGTGALNIDACRVGADGGRKRSGEAPQGRAVAAVYAGPADYADAASLVPGLGRWPANVVLTHPPAVDGGDACAAGCVPGCPVADLDTQSGTLTSGANPTRRGSDGDRTAYGTFAGQYDANPQRGLDTGGASRFFPTFRYQAKADTAQRPRARRVGERVTDTGTPRQELRCARCRKQRVNVAGSFCTCDEPDFQPDAARDGFIAHPTVKPLDLMRWLVRLVTPPGGTVLDLFAGSGTTGEACTLEGFQCWLVEREADYLPLIVDRLTRRSDPVAHLTAKAARGEAVDLGLFADLEEGA